jgi:hypothetical protein
MIKDHPKVVKKEKWGKKWERKDDKEEKGKELGNLFLGNLFSLFSQIGNDGGNQEKKGDDQGLAQVVFHQRPEDKGQNARDSVRGSPGRPEGTVKVTRLAARSALGAGRTRRLNPATIPRHRRRSSYFPFVFTLLILTCWSG